MAAKLKKIENNETNKNEGWESPKIQGRKKYKLLIEKKNESTQK